MPEPTNGVLARLFSAEWILTVITLVFLGGLAWGQQKDATDTNAKAIGSTVDTVNSMDSRMRTLEMDAAAAKQDRKYFRETLQEMKEGQKEILKELRRD